MSWKKEKEGESKTPVEGVELPAAEEKKEEKAEEKVVEETEESRELTEDDFARLNELSHTLSRVEAIATEMTYHDEFMNPERYDALNLLALSADFLKLNPSILNAFSEYIEKVHEAEKKVIEQQKQEEHEVG